MTAIPPGLGPGGKRLWKSIDEAYDLDAAQLAQLEEACRAKDRCDRLDKIIQGDEEVWAHLTHNLATHDYELKIDHALTQANATANLMKQLLAALRLPDEATGKRPQVRAARGAYKSGGGKVSSLEKARAAKSS